MAHGVVRLMVVVVGIVALAASVAHAQTTANCTFEDGQLCYLTRSSMAVPPKILVESNGNHYLQITASASDNTAIPDSLKATWNRAFVNFLAHYSNMPLTTSANRFQTYEFRVRWSSNTAPFSYTGQLFQFAPGGETYAQQNGTGPVVGWGRSAQKVEMWNNFDNETQRTTHNFGNLPAGVWNHFKIVAEWSLPGSNVGRLEFWRNDVLAQTITGRSVSLGPESSRIPSFELGVYGEFVGTIDFDDVKVYPTGSPPGSTDPPPPPPQPVVRYIAPAGSGTACSSASPCSFTQGFSALPPGSTVYAAAGTYTNIRCEDCTPSGLSGTQHTILQGTTSGTPVAVGARGLTVTPATTIFQANTDTILKFTDRQFVTIKNVVFEATGSGSNPVVDLGAASGVDLTSDLLLENVTVKAPLRSGSGLRGLRLATKSARIKVRQSRITRVGPPVDFGESVTPSGIGLVVCGDDHTIEDSDIDDNFGLGVDTGVCVGWPHRLQFLHNRVLGNGDHAVVLIDGDSIRATGNILAENGRSGLWLNGAKRVLAYQNALYRNGRRATYPGIEIAGDATGVVRNNITIGHSGAEIVNSAPSSQVACSDNLSGDAAASTGCTTETLNAVATDEWVDPDHPTLRSRDFTLKAGAQAIDNGTPGICTSADTSANRCADALTLTSYTGSAPDQGAKEFEAPATPMVVSHYTCDDTPDDAVGPNEGTNTGVTFDATNKIAGTHACDFDATSDRISIPTAGWNRQSFTIATSARPESFAAVAYLLGGTSCPPSYCGRIQIYYDTAGYLNVGLGGSHKTLRRAVPSTLNTYERIVLVAQQGSTDGAGTATLYVEGQPAASGSYSGLTQLPSSVTIGNNGAYNTEGMNGQIDEVLIGNYAWSQAEVNSDFTTYSPPEPGPYDAVGSLDLHQCELISSVDIRCVPDGNPDPAECQAPTFPDQFHPLINGVEVVPTSCEIAGTPPVFSLVLATAADADDVVTLVYGAPVDPDDELQAIPVVNRLGNPPPPVAVNLLSCISSVSGLQSICQAQGRLDAAVCTPLTDWDAREACVSKPITACAVAHNVGDLNSTVTITRVAPPASGSVGLSLAYLPGNQILTVTNLFDPGAIPEEENPPPAGLEVVAWWCRPDGPDTTTKFFGTPNTACRAPSPGGINVRLAIANESGGQVTNFRTSLFAATHDGVSWTAMMRVGSDFGSMDVRYGPTTTSGIPDGATLTESVLPAGANTPVEIGRFRRSEPTNVFFTLADDEQMEEELAIQFASGLALGTKFSFQLRDQFGQPFSSHIGEAGCETAGPGSSNVCGAVVVIGRPRVY